jgi:hypothetical protein
MTDTASDRTSCSILDWDRAHPEDKTKWVLQQPALIDIEPPYVYTVVSRIEDRVITSKRCMLILMGSSSAIQRKGDRGGLEAAVLSAVKTPIDRYIREYELRLRSHTQLTCTLDENPTAPRMTIEAMRDRMRIFLGVNWHWQARNLVEDMPEVSERRCVQFVG